MEAKAQNDRFTTNAMKLPMVSLGYQQALAYYLRAKEWSPLVHRSLSIAENTVKFAAGTAQPIVGAQLVKADHMAATLLGYVENKYPAIKKTPEEIKACYYDGSRLQKGIDSAYVAKNFGFQQIANTRNAVDFAVHNPTEAAMTTIRFSIVAMNWALDNLEATIDRHVAKPDAKRGPDNKPTTIAGRLGQIYGKTTDGVKFHAAHHLDALKTSFNEQIKQIHAAMVVIEFARRQSDAASKQVEYFWAGAKEKSAATTLNTTKYLTQTLSHTTERMSNFAGPYLPETGRKSLTTATDYARDLARTFNEADSLTDLKDEVVAQAKVQLGAIQTGFTNAFDFLMQRISIGQKSAPHENMNGTQGNAHPADDRRPDGSTTARCHEGPTAVSGPVLFERPATLMFLKPDGSVKQKQQGTIQIVADAEMCGYRIRFTNDANGAVALDQAITMEMNVKSTAGKTGNFAEWTGWDSASREAVKRVIKLQLSNKSAVNEFAENFRKGVQLAKLNQISEEQLCDANPRTAPKEISGMLRAPQLK